MSVLRSERFLYFQNKARHYQQLQNIKSAIDSSPPKRRSPHRFRPRTLMEEKSIQEENQHLIQRLVNIEHTQRPQIQAEGTYSRYHKVDRPFRNINLKRKEHLRSVTIDNDQLKTRLQKARAAVGSQSQWEREYTHSLCAQNNLRKFPEKDKSKGDLVISTDRFMPRHLRDYAYGQDQSPSMSGKATSLSREKLFALPRIEKPIHVEWTFQELDRKGRQEQAK